MLKQIVAILLIVVASACHNNQKVPVNQPQPTTAIDTVAILKDPNNNLDIQTRNFTEIDSSGILMFPLSFNEPQRGSESSSYYNSSSSIYWNIIFFNSRTNAYHLLSENKMLITNYTLKEDGEGARTMTLKDKFIFYLITVNDYDKDDQLTSDDPRYLFISDKEGNNLKQISPNNCDVLNWQYIRSVNKVLMTVKPDSDKNNKFDDKDEVLSFEYVMESGSEPRQIFSADFTNKLKILYSKDWKKIN